MDNIDPTLKDKDPKEKELLKKIAYHEAYSTAYKLKFVQVVAFKGAKALGRAAVKGGQHVKKKWNERKK